MVCNRPAAATEKPAAMLKSQLPPH
ncbi:hypothetical protein HNQ50_001492 [Silvimonas terrae]|uniref:Uncharacterized protein n=1 Tax=Silvimonas terrae TaxID=300266 RepID=A0A840REG7_9NEIS|nr:hypothetical protein [Silvimonas terrae]